MPRPEDSGGPLHPRPIGCFVLPSGTLKPSASATSSSRSRTSTKGERGLPYGLQDTLPTLNSSCSQPSGYSATDPRLDTGGWLTLVKRPYDLFSRQGLSPGKHRRALPSAITPKLSGRSAVEERRQDGPLERLVNPNSLDSLSGAYYLLTELMAYLVLRQPSSVG
jgi:hypothetical protein